ncbi:MAG: hypothetical protein SV186_00310 [Candidatus Nanohaloarchaea archaeon]|nr:hypothetical protein [Candidatus Nanohaloarchaea archaeon]
MKLLALNSGGLDSPVATHRMLAKGFDMEAVVFDNRPFTDEEDIETAVATVEELAESHDASIPLHTVPHGFVQEAYLQEADDEEVDYACLFSRRMMFRVASELASRRDAGGLVTGENLAQVASQTLDNMVVIDDAATVPVFRPVLGLDNYELSQEARRIGTFDLSRQGGIVCSATPDHPETHGTLERMREIEERFDLGDLVDRSLERAETQLVNER